MKKILTFLLVSCSVFSSYAQQIPGYLIYNNLQTNAAFAGQDSLSFNASAYINTEYLKSKRYRLEGAPYEFQLSISDHLKKINSGVGLFSSLESVGIEKYYVVGGIYNYNYIINEVTNLRFGFRANVNVIKVDYDKVFTNLYEEDLIRGVETISRFSLDPAVWYFHKGLNIGFAVQNILNEKDYLTPSSFYLTSYYESFKSGNLCFVPAIQAQYFSSNNHTHFRLNTQLNFELFNGLLLNTGIEFSSNNRYDFGLGIKFSEHVKFLMGYSTGGLYSKYFSGLLKLNF